MYLKYNNIKNVRQLEEIGENYVQHPKCFLTLVHSKHRPSCHGQQHGWDSIVELEDRRQQPCENKNFITTNTIKASIYCGR